MCNLLLADLPEDSVPDYSKCAEIVHKLAYDHCFEEQELMPLLLSPDCRNPHWCFHSLLREKLLFLTNNPVISLLESSQEIHKLIRESTEQDTPEVYFSVKMLILASCILFCVFSQLIAKLLKAVFSANVKHIFHKINVHSGK